MRDTAAVTTKGARRWAAGHPWIYRSDVTTRPERDAGAVAVQGPNGAPLGWALWSPASEISLRLIDRDPRAVIDDAWWRERLARALARRKPLEGQATAYRLVHGE
jgi:23S rRNA (cytosine1962-C5)-methyltransferase